MTDTRAWKWSTLPPLALSGLGTAHVESMASYVARLSATQGQSTLAFLDSLDELCNERPLRNDRARCALIGPGRRFMVRLIALEELTGGQILRPGTLYAIAAAIRPGSEGLANARHWCPVCLDEFVQSGVSGRLSWVFSDLSHCSLHFARIESYCWRCKSQQPFAPGSANIQSCVLCGASLSAGAQSAKGVAKQALWTDGCIEELVGFLSSNPPMVVPGGYESYIERLSKMGALSKSHHAFRRGAPSIRSLLNVCAYMGVHLVDVLLCPDDLPVDRLVDGEEEPRLLSVPVESRNLQLRRLEYLLEALAGERHGLVPPLAVLLERYGLSASVKQLKERNSYQCYLRRHKLQKCILTSRTSRPIIAAAFSMLDSGVPTEKAVQNLSESTRISVRALEPYVRCVGRVLVLEGEARAAVL